MHLRIKICGVTRAEDARLAIGLGADAVGLNFYPQSPRFVTEEQAVEIVHAMPPLTTPVAVFVEPTLEQLNYWWTRLAVRTFQLHGFDPAALAPTFGAMSWAGILAQPVSDADDLEKITALVRDWKTGAQDLPDPAVLVDARVDGLHGGTGETVPWHLLGSFEAGAPLILAGGLTPENVAEAVRTVKPFAIDVASGVESSPGVKDPEKLRRFIANARDAAAAL
jgi:phosphoribosylanthranilate isomerase